MRAYAELWHYLLRIQILSVHENCSVIRFEIHTGPETGVYLHFDLIADLHDTPIYSENLLGRKPFKYLIDFEAFAEFILS